MAIVSHTSDTTPPAASKPVRTIVVGMWENERYDSREWPASVFRLLFSRMPINFDLAYDLRSVTSVKQRGFDLHPDSGNIFSIEPRRVGTLSHPSASFLKADADVSAPARPNGRSR